MPRNTDKKVDSVTIGSLMIDLMEDASGFQYFLVYSVTPRTQYCSLCGEIVEFNHLKIGGGVDDVQYTDDAGHIYQEPQ